MQKLIKINTNHYVVVDDSEIKEGDWIYNPDREPSLLQCIGKGSIRGWKKITHSTQPLGIGWQQEVIELSLQEVKELIGEVDVEKKALSQFDSLSVPYSSEEDDYEDGWYVGYIRGYNQALADNKEKKYTEEDMRKAFDAARRCITMPIGGAKHQYYDEYSVADFDEYKREILPAHTSTEWEVEIVDGKLKLV